MRIGRLACAGLMAAFTAAVLQSQGPDPAADLRISPLQLSLADTPDFEPGDEQNSSRRQVKVRVTGTRPLQHRSLFGGRTGGDVSVGWIRVKPSAGEAMDCEMIRWIDPDDPAVIRVVPPNPDKEFPANVRVVPSCRR